ncbi:MAG: hypothetical protein ACR2FY_22050 [Pirellulaceae bacterium]
MSLTMYGKLSDEQSERLEAIETQVDQILTDRLGKRAIWMCPDGKRLRLIRAADSAVLFEVPVSEFDRITDKALLERVESSLGSSLPADINPSSPPPQRSLNYTGVYLYVDGSDLEAIAAKLTAELKAVVPKQSRRMRVINHRSERTPDLQPEDLPDWRLGLNIDRTDKLGADLKRAVEGVVPLAKKYQREFVVGYFDTASGISEDVAFFKNATTAKRALADVWAFLDIPPVK